MTAIFVSAFVMIFIDGVRSIGKGTEGKRELQGRLEDIDY